MKWRGKIDIEGEGQTNDKDGTVAERKIRVRTKNKESGGARRKVRKTKRKTKRKERREECYWVAGKKRKKGS